MAIIPKSGFHIPRQSVVGSEGLFTKMFDPPKDSPPTPEKLNLIALPPEVTANVRANPVPEVMLAAGLQDKVSTPHVVERDLLHGLDLDTWDGLKKIMFYTFRDGDNPTANGTYPAPAVRVPRGALFHSQTQGHGPPPHTIHWHGIEPTPINDGVGHCSMELGDYTYQWQPNFIGTYFYHCHRNTMQHFEFGLFGLMLFHPPDAWFASIDPLASTLPDGPYVLNNIPVGAGRDGKFRTAANLLPLAAAVRRKFPGFIAGDPIQGVNVADPWTGDPFLKFATDPHAFTVPYDVEALWVLDDRDSVWSDLGPDARATFPKFGSIPGVDDNFVDNPGQNGFFNFNDFNADYWYITGVPVPAHKGGTAAIPAGIKVPPALNSGIGMVGAVVDPTKQSQVSIQALVGQTVFIRCLDAAYNSTRVTFPKGLDVVIIEWDGRALGVPPLNKYTKPQLVRGGTPITHSTARRWGAIFNAPLSFKGKPNIFAKVEFLDTRSGDTMKITGGGDVLVTAQIPIQIT